MAVRVFKRCSCREAVLDVCGRSVTDRLGKPRFRRLGEKCQQIDEPDHGSWYFSVPLPALPVGPRRYTYLKRGGYRSSEQAHQVGAAVEQLFLIPDRDDDAGQSELTTMVVRALDNGAELPDYEKVRERYRCCEPLAPAPTLAEWLDFWLPLKRHLTPSTFIGYETHIRLYLKPHLGRHRIDRLRVDHIEDMLELIEEENELIAVARKSKDPELCARFCYRRQAG